jgi:cytochrome b pre-mRNA-processing protein 3
MNAITRWLEQRKVNKGVVETLHDRLIKQVRTPAFYTDGHVADRLEGRFELACLHATLLLRRLRAVEPRGRELAQAVFDRVFFGFDQALRDEGVGDLSVGKRIRKMGEAFYGRAKAYDKALNGADRASALAQAIGLSFGHDQAETRTQQLVAYVISAEDALTAQVDEDMLAGRVAWPEPVLGA